MDQNSLIKASARNTVAKFKDLWLRNLRANFERARAAPPLLVLKNSFKPRDGMCAALVGSGESLDLAIDRLKDLKNRALIICADRSLRALVEHGVKPDIVATIDPEPVIADYFRDVDTTNIILVMSILQDPSTWKTWRGDVLFYLQEITPRVEEIEEQYQQIQIGKVFVVIPPLAGVSGILCSLAYETGCTKVLFVGIDFAFREADYDDPERKWDKARDEDYELKRFWAFAKCIAPEPQHFGREYQTKITPYKHSLTGEEHWTTWEMIAIHSRAIEVFTKKLRMYSISPFRVLEGYGIPHGSWDEIRPHVSWKLIDIMRALRKPKRFKLPTRGGKVEAKSRMDG